MSKKIEIYIACHKPSYLPKNDLFVPIHVGAAKSAIRMPIQRDDEGENISEKNPHYCEMTAQYWAYRHSKADYIGLCHYRRFLSFSEKTFRNLTDDNRGHVEIAALTRATADYYGLTDERRMRDVIGAYDILVPAAQDLSRVATPIGLQKTVLRHWLAHDRALIRNGDLKKLLNLVKKHYPLFYVDLIEYLNGNQFYGYNTLVMRRDLFCRMSELEFDLIGRLEKEVDLSGYNLLLSRIYGFMGEILSSAYIYHLKKRDPSLRVKECQLLYFDDTDPEKRQVPIFSAEEHPVQIVLDVQSWKSRYAVSGPSYLAGQELQKMRTVSELPAFLGEPALKSILSHLTQNRKYDIILLMNDKKKYYGNYYTELSQNDDIRIRTHSAIPLLKELEALYGKAEYPIALFLPWILKDWKKVLYLSWNTLANQSPDRFFDIDMGDAALCGSEDIEYAGRLNGHRKEDRKYIKEVLGAELPSRVLNDSAILMDLDQLRKMNQESLARIVACACKKNKWRYPSAGELFSISSETKIKWLGQGDIHRLCTDPVTEEFIAEAPLPLMNTYKAVSLAVIDSFSPDSWWQLEDDPEFYQRYWKLIKEGAFEELFREYKARFEMNHVRSWFDQRILLDNIKDVSAVVLPYGSGRREALKSVCRGIGKIGQRR